MERIKIFGGKKKSRQYNIHQGSAACGPRNIFCWAQEQRENFKIVGAGAIHRTEVMGPKFFFLLICGP